MALVVRPAKAEWSPRPEPEKWQTVRRTLEASGDLPRADWIFLEATSGEMPEAAEYLRSLERDGSNVNFLGALVLRRSVQSNWIVRPIGMRALCSDGVLQRRDASGAWTAYPGRPGTPDRVRWICAQR